MVRGSVATGALLVLFALRLSAATSPANPLMVSNLGEVVLQSSSPHDFAQVFTRTVFVASSPGTGRELYRTDGTTGGTVLVRDINPGAGDSIWGELITVGGGDAFFAADDGVHGLELWHTDGTAAGTFMVKDICPGSCWGAPAAIFSYPPYGIYFSANDGVNGQEVWYADSNGASASAVLVENIAPGPASSSPQDFTLVQGRLFFTADHPTYGREPWVREATTHLVEDIYPGATGSSPASLVAASDRLFFLADDGTSGMELWSSDYIAGSAYRVADINPGAASGITIDREEMLVVSGSSVYVVADDGTHGREVWIANTATASMVKDVCVGACAGGVEVLTVLPMFVPTLLFATDSGELWKTSGTAAATSHIPTIAGGETAVFEHFIARGSGTTAFFAASDTVAGPELWKTDGTTASRVKEFTSSGPATGAYVNGALYLNAETLAEGAELWKSDGTESGTVLVRNIAEDVAGGEPVDIAGADGLALASMIATVSAGREPVFASGAVNAFGVRDVNPGSGSSGPSEFVLLGDAWYFAATTAANGRELWKTTSSSASATLVKDIHPGALSSSPASLTVVNGVLYFSADDGTHGRELWKSDGTAAGTVLVEDIAPGIGSAPEAFVAGGSTLFFTAIQSATGRELWKSDGTAAGTTLLGDINPGSESSSIASPAFVGGLLFFAATDAFSGAELWMTDGSTVTQVRDINPGAPASSPSFIAALGAQALFFADDGTHGRELWRSDGTTVGTVLVSDFRVGSNGCDVTSAPVPYGSHVWVAADCGTSGVELYKADGASGLSLVKDICAGACSSNPRELTVVGSKLFFSAFTEANGFEPWVSEGTTGTTALFGDLETGGVSSDPRSLHATGNLLFFSAYTSAAGRELWTACAQPATIFDVFGSAPIVTGQPFTLLFSPRDGSSRYVPCWGGTIHFTSSDPAATLPPDTDFPPGGSTRSAQVTLSALGSQSVTITDTANPSLTATFNVEVRHATTTTLAADNAVTYSGAPLQLTATVQSAGGVPAGQVVFRAGTTVLGAPTLSGGQAVLTVTTLPPGSSSLTAQYNGSATFAGSTSSAVSHWVIAPAPANLVATAAGTTAVTVSWDAAAGAQQYRIYRSDAGLTFEPLITIGAETPLLVDASVAANTSYLYSVTTIDAQGHESPFSNDDLATTVAFTDDPLTTSTVVKGAHLTELRAAVNAVRALNKQGPATFSANVSPGSAVVKLAIEELRSQVTTLRNGFELPPVSFTDPTLTTVVIKRVHVMQLRDALR